ncbi:hypothetical protein GN956_G12489 [Arapaima gigas]
MKRRKYPASFPPSSSSSSSSSSSRTLKRGEKKAAPPQSHCGIASHAEPHSLMALCHSGCQSGTRLSKSPLDGYVKTASEAPVIDHARFAGIEMSRGRAEPRTCAHKCSAPSSKFTGMKLV